MFGWCSEQSLASFGWPCLEEPIVFLTAGENAFPPRPLDDLAKSVSKASYVFTHGELP